ncbi:MAG TPA: hypothetical protein VJ252_07375, partial [Chthoniobacterales bacterium]|nr:hypothetical protein [Chthoniobacterales bacterium]
FHDVEPIERIVGERRAFYMAVSCSEPIWKRKFIEMSVLNKNRYDAPHRSNIMSQLQRLFSVWR